MAVLADVPSENWLNDWPFWLVPALGYLLAFVVFPTIVYVALIRWGIRGFRHYRDRNRAPEGHVRVRIHWHEGRGTPEPFEGYSTPARFSAQPDDDDVDAWSIVLTGVRRTAAPGVWEAYMRPLVEWCPSYLFEPGVSFTLLEAGPVAEGEIL